MVVVVVAGHTVGCVQTWNENNFETSFFERLAAVSHLCVLFLCTVLFIMVVWCMMCAFRIIIIKLNINKILFIKPETNLIANGVNFHDLTCTRFVLRTSIKYRNDYRKFTFGRPHGSLVTETFTHLYVLRQPGGVGLVGFIFIKFRKRKKPINAYVPIFYYLY